MQTRVPHELIDLGGGARLERFGERLVDRPHPAALGSRRTPARWHEADLRFDRDRGWTGSAVGNGPWPIELDGLSLELRPTETGQVGLFPEHLAMLAWLQARVGERVSASVEPAAPTTTSAASSVLHLFAYTGLATLAIAAAGGSVTHVDSSRPTVAWARRNAERSHLADRPVRWIVDDATTFALREARRGRRYGGVVLDPPSYGHGPAGRSWRLEEDLESLLEAAVAVLAPGGFVLLTAHTTGFGGDRLGQALARALARRATTVERGTLALSTADGRDLELGAFARWPGGA